MLEHSEILQILADTDPLGFIRAGADDAVYAPASRFISYALHDDITRLQVQKIIWQAFYIEYCEGTIAGTDPAVPWSLGKEYAHLIIGKPSRYKNVADVIRELFNY